SLELHTERPWALAIAPSLKNVGFEVEPTPRLHLIQKPVANSKPHVAAKLNVGAAARHVGGDGDRARHAGLGDDLGLLLVIAGVEDGEHLRLGGALAARIERRERVGVGKVVLLPAGLAHHLPGRLPASCSDFSIEVVPTSTGCPRALQSSMSARIERNFSVDVR